MTDDANTRAQVDARAIVAKLKPLHNPLAAQDWPLRAELWIAEALAARDAQLAPLARFLRTIVDQLDVLDLELEAERLWGFLLAAGLAHREPYDPDGPHEHIAGLDGVEPGDMITVLTPMAEAIIGRVDTVRRATPEEKNDGG